MAGMSAVVAASLGGGCETISQDFNDLAKGIVAPTPRAAAEMALDQHDPDRRREGTLLLANAPWGGNPTYLRMYRDYVQFDNDPLVKATAIRALAKHGVAEDAPLLAPHLVNDNVQVRWEAAKGLQRLHNPVVVPDLLATLGREDEHSDVRVAAACALGQYPEDRVFQGLVAALDVRELAVNIQAGRSLGLLTGQDFGLEPRAWLEWYNSVEGDRFAGGGEYLYPTYHRELSWLEKLAFWSVRVEEHPAPPAGLRPSDERRTYGDEEGENEQSGGD
jgi:hypothetical protein